MIYRRQIQVEFNHCDPAGIVFYPRYFEMTNSVVENFFGHVLGYPYSRIHLEEHSGVPTVRIEAEFRAPSRLGEILDFTLEIDRVGNSSVRLALRASTGGQPRMLANLTLVWVTPNGRAASWPERIRQKMNDFKEQGHGA